MQPWLVKAPPLPTSPPHTLMQKPTVAQLWPRRQGGRFPGSCGSFSLEVHSGKLVGLLEAPTLSILPYLPLQNQLGPEEPGYLNFWSNAKAGAKQCSCLFSLHHLSSVILHNCWLKTWNNTNVAIEGNDFLMSPPFSQKWKKKDVFLL